MVPIAARKVAVIVDEMGAISAAMEALKPRKKRYDELREQLLATLSDLAPDDTRQVEGSLYVADVSAQSKDRVIRDMRKLARKLGKGFWEHANLPMGKLDKLLLPAEQSKFLAEERGARTVKLFAKAKAA